MRTTWRAWLIVGRAEAFLARRMKLAEAMQLFEAEADVVEDPPQEALLERPTCVDGNSDAAAVCRPF